MTRVGWVVVASVIATGAAGASGPTTCLVPAMPRFLQVVPTLRAAARDAGQAARPSYDEIVKDLGATNPEVRLAAMRALGASGYPQAMSAISRLLTDPEDDIQLEAIDTLLNFFVDARPPRRKRVALVVEVRQKVGAEAVYDMGPFALLPRQAPADLVLGLASAMRDQSAQVRLEATYGLGVMAHPPLDPTAAEALAAAMSDREAAVRLAAVRVAGGLRVDRVGDALIGAVNDPEEAVRLAAMRSLGDIRDRRAVVALGEQFDYYRKGPAAVAAFDALARIGDAQSVPRFEQQRGSSDPVFRRLAYEGLARANSVGDAASVEAVAASEKVQAVAMAAAFAAAKAGRGTVPLIVRGIGRPDTEALAMAYLVELGQPSVVALELALRDPDPRVRERAAQALGLIGGESSLAALERAGRDPDLAVSRAIERAVARARGATAPPSSEP